MEQDSAHNNKVGSVLGCHVEDSITFWAQDINRQDDISKASCELAEICRRASPVFGNPDLTKIYGGCFSEDKCWYRCKVLKVISDEKCQVLYIDYGNSEILSRSEIVEIPVQLQFPSVAKKYLLWDLQLPVSQNLNVYDQGRKFLNSLIYEKELKIRYKAVCTDGSILVQAECGLLDVGQEMAKKGFAEKCRPPRNSNICDTQSDSFLYQPKNGKNSAPPRGTRGSSSPIRTLKGGFGDQLLPVNVRSENNSGNYMSLVSREKMAACTMRRAPGITLEKIKQEQKIVEENENLKVEKEALKKENQNLLHQCEELELKAQKLAHDLQEEVKAKKESQVYMESILPVYIGTTVRSLADKFEKLKKVRQESMAAHFGEDLSKAVKVVTEGVLATSLSMEKLEQAWQEYNASQEEIRFCKDVEIVQGLILHRNEVQQKLYSAIEEFIVEVDSLPLLDRLKRLQELQGSLEAVYGPIPEQEGSEGAFEKFFQWKNVNLEKFCQLKNATDESLQNLVTSLRKIVQFFDMGSNAFLKIEDITGSVDDVLKNSDLAISQELDMFLTEPDEVDRNIILNVYIEAMQKVCQEQQLLRTVHHKYLDSVEFKKEVVEWLDTTPNIDRLLLIKKKMKNLKAQLRWKLVEKNNFEESDEYSEFNVVNIKEEIAELRNEVFQEIYREQEEYEKLNQLVQKWFPELPLLHPEAGILKYMNAGGLLTGSLERDLLDAEPMKELTTKRPVLCSEIQGQKVLIKGYAVGLTTETEIIERAAQYHKVWRQLKEESGLMQLMFLFLCKSDPVAYLMVPYYDGASLAMLQSSRSLTPEETRKVMKGAACGLHSLHAAGIVHGSLHHKNVFTINRERGIVGDFDFTKSEHLRASLNSVELNGLSLTSPELKQGQPPSPSSDMYAYGCLLYWLLIGNQEFKINSDGTPEMDGLTDTKAKSLLMNLLCCNGRMTSEQALNDEYFLLPSVVSIPPEDKQTECENSEERTEDELVPDVKQDEETEFAETMEPDGFECE